MPSSSRHASCVRSFGILLALATALSACERPSGVAVDPAPQPAPAAVASQGSEGPLDVRALRQLTFDGKRSGEGYFSRDGRAMVFQSEREEGNPFYQIYWMDLMTGATRRVSPGVGKTTCAWIHPSGERVLFASTHADPASRSLQQKEIAERTSGQERRYSWDYDEHYDLYAAALDDSAPVRLTRERGYDAEGSYSPDGTRIAFASNRHAYVEKLSEAERAEFERDPSSRMDIYIARADGTDPVRLTSEPGYDGGPFFSPDGTRIVWRRFAPDGATAEIFSMKTDGSDVRQLTRLGVMSWAPFYHPSGDYLIFATNVHGFDNFELYMVGADPAVGNGTPVRITQLDGFDGLPVFVPSGDRLTWTRRGASGSAGGQFSQIMVAPWDDARARQLLGLPASTQAARPAPSLAPPVDAAARDRVRQHVAALTGPGMDGRLAGTEGELAATIYVASRFEALGLAPAGAESYFDPFEFSAGVALGKANELRLEASGAGGPQGGGSRAFELEREWRPLAFSRTGDAPAAGVVFAGYGIVAPAEQEQAAYDSYAGLDVKDRWVMVLRDLPGEVGAERRQHLSRYASIRYKAMLARDRGALGMILVSGPLGGFKESIVPLSFDGSLGATSAFAVSVGDGVAEALLAPSGRTLEALQRELATGEVKPGLALDAMRLSARVDLVQEKKRARNVLGRLRLDGDPRAEPIVIGAHIDHLGKGEAGSSLARSEERGQVHPGADDNASGVAAMLEIATRLVESRAKLEGGRDVIFAAWSAEELGLLGSAHYMETGPRPVQEARGPSELDPTLVTTTAFDAKDLAEQPIRTIPETVSPHGSALAASPHGGSPHGTPPRKVAAYLNLDMVGRPSGPLYVQGVGSSSIWAGEVERANVGVGLPIVTQNDSYLPTDATSFYLKGVPILSLFTGVHEDYHSPRDTADKLDYDAIARSARLVEAIAGSLSAQKEVPDYVALDATQRGPMRANLRAYLGTIPSYGRSDVVGLLIQGVAKGGPAERAGLRADDVIVELAGRKVENVYDYTYAIEALKIGEPVKVAVQRGAERLVFELTPTSRD
jgi:Tol biopolymer transport system component/Zn-dependent M28 family amino/carboxypeptidase